MDDAFLMRVLDGSTNLNEQIKPFPGGEVILVAVIRDLDAPHQFHDEIRPAGFRRAGVQHLGNVRMIHQSQRLPLGLESSDDTLGVHTQFDDLERDPAANGFLLFGHIHHTAAAFADLLQKLVAADSVAGLIDWNGRRTFEEVTGFVTGLKQFFNTLAEGRIVGTGLVKKSRALPGRQPEGSAKDGHFAIRRIGHVQADFTLCSSKRKSRAKGAKNFTKNGFAEDDSEILRNARSIPNNWTGVKILSSAKS
jgi:hypothetical protein